MSTESEQGRFLTELRDKKTPVSIFLTSGIRLNGVISAFDEYTIFLNKPIPQVVYKQAIATILPQASEKDYSH